MTTGCRVLVAAASIGVAACSGSRGARSGDSVSTAKDSTSVARVDSSVQRADSAPDSTRAAAPPKNTSGSPGGAPAPAGSPQPTPAVSPSETVLTGKVVSGGLAETPVTQLQIEGGKPTTLIGPLEPELRRLGGAMVWVTGSPVSTTPNATFNVTRYEIVSIGGAKPLVGRVFAREGATWLATARDTVKLVSAPADLAAKAGATIWVVGQRSGNAMTPQTYGVIREP